jgi:DNA-binding winged helix-turn-helix (wHTH) protein
VSASPQRVLQFGRCQLLADEYELRRDGKPVRLGGRAFEILVMLAGSPGRLITKDEILERIWPGMVVEENTLQVHICALRKALGPDRAVLKTVSGRGYRFVARASTVARAQPPGEAPLVLVLDGCEHVIDAATRMARVVDELAGDDADACEPRLDTVREAMSRGIEKLGKAIETLREQPFMKK